MGSAELPALTRLILQPAWSFGAPLAVIALGAGALITRLRYAMLGVALFAVVLAALTYQGLLGPMFALAGNVR